MKNLNEFVSGIANNAVFVLEFLGIVALVILVAYLIEKLVKKKEKDTERVLNTRTVVVVGVFSAISGILMSLEIPMVFMIPEFYKLDFSELPALIAGFAFGPVAGVLVEFIKLPIKLLLKPSGTAFVGELANFLIGCALVLPSSIIYRFWRKKSGAVVGCVVGTIAMTVFGAVLNAFYLLPTFAVMFFGGEEALSVIIAMGTAINPAITGLETFVLFAVAPHNLIKATLVSILAILLYQPLRPFMKATKKSK